MIGMTWKWCSSVPPQDLSQLVLLISCACLVGRDANAYVSCGVSEESCPHLLATKEAQDCAKVFELALL